MDDCVDTHQPIGKTMVEEGRYRARLAACETDVRAAQALRHLAFKGHLGGLDCDGFDPLCQHYLIEEVQSGRLVCVFRLLPLANGRQIESCYAAQYYELTALQAFDGRMVEVGRFCTHPEVQDPDILRVAWAEITRYVDVNDIALLFGCASFQGTDPERYLDSFALLRDRHLAPRHWAPKIKASDVYAFAQKAPQRSDLKLAQKHMPPMLRSYLMMGGWVSDHAVVDREMQTLHVFTGVEVNAIPPARKRLLRALAG